MGPEGAHQVFNRGEETIRVLMLSTLFEPSVAVYPDSDKIGVWPGDERDNIMVRRSSNVEYSTARCRDNVLGMPPQLVSVNGVTVRLIAEARMHDRSLAPRLLAAPQLPEHWREWAQEPAAPV